MASYDDYDRPTRQRSTKSYYREERRDDPRDPYLNVQSRDLVPQPRQDSDLSIEEIRRDFPPPGYSSRDIRRARSAEGGYYNEYDDRPRSSYGREREYDRDYDRDYERPRSHRKSSMTYYEEEEHTKVRMLSKQEQIIAAITGAALAIGGKEAFDRREASQHGSSEVQRNVLASAALGAAGAFAGYQGTEFYNKHKEKEAKKVVHKGAYYSDEEDDGKEKKSNKNFLESALAAAGLGGAIKALGGKSDKGDDKSDTRSRRGSPSRSEKSDKGKGDGKNKIQKAAMASLIAGATEAFRVSKEPGGWKGEKAKRIFTAAAGAATIDAAQKSEKAGSKMGLAESVIGGLVGNRVINGSKKNIDEDPKTGRSRSRSRAASSSGGGGASGLAALATAGLGAFGAKKIYDKVEEKKEERSRSRRPRSRSRDSYDSRDGSPDKRHRSRSRSVVDKARRGMAKLGIGNGPSDDESDVRDRSRDRRDRDRSRRRDDDYDDAPRGSRRHRDRKDDYSDDDRDYRRSAKRDDYDSDRSDRGGRDRDRSRQRGDRDRGTVAKRRDASRGGSESDLGDSEDDEKEARKKKGKQILTTGLAAVATIHAAHNVYQSMDKRQKRQKALREGRITAEEAEKLKKRAILQDVASVGVAALGIKGAISEMKEAREKAAEVHEWKEMKEERHRRRLERLRQLKADDGRDYGRQRADIWYPAAPPRAGRYDEGPRYLDGNPYSALPPTPTGDRR